jgi:hypothetical protein
MMSGVVVGDFNGDGKQDLAVAIAEGSNVSIFLRDCAATPTPTPTPTPGPSVQWSSSTYTAAENIGSAALGVN